MVFPLAVLPLAAAGSGIMSKGGDSGGGADAAAQMQAQLANKLVEQTDPLRAALISRSQQFLNGGMDVTASPVFSALKSQTESQFANARNNLIADTPAGGPLIQALTDLNSNRANTLGQGAGAIADTELSRALSLATGQTGQAMSGLGQSASVQAMLAQANADREAGLYGALGTGLGAYMGSKA